MLECTHALLLQAVQMLDEGRMVSLCTSGQLCVFPPSHSRSPPGALVL
jgi:hypothetical protein